MNEIDLVLVRADGTRRYCVYTIRDASLAVRYVGMSLNPLSRFGQHRQYMSAIGEFIRAQESRGRQLFIEVEEVFETRKEAQDAEQVYIAGYRRLLGDFLFNESADGLPRVKKKKVCNPFDCIRERCIHSQFKQGLCESHYIELMRNAWGLYAKRRKEYVKRCVDAGLLLPDDPAALTPEIIARDVYLEFHEQDYRSTRIRVKKMIQNGTWRSSQVRHQPTRAAGFEKE